MESPKAVSFSKILCVPNAVLHTFALHRYSKTFSLYCYPNRYSTAELYTATLFRDAIPPPTLEIPKGAPMTSSSFLRTRLPASTPPGGTEDIEGHEGQQGSNNIAVESHRTGRRAHGGWAGASEGFTVLPSPPPVSFPTVPHHPLGDGHQVTVPHPPPPPGGPHPNRTRTFAGTELAA